MSKKDDEPRMHRFEEFEEKFKEMLAKSPKEVDRALKDAVVAGHLSWEEIFPDDPQLVYLLNLGLTAYSKLCKGSRQYPRHPDSN